MNTKLTYKNIEGIVLDFAKQMHRDKFIPEYIVSIIPGGLLPGVLLSEYLGVEMYALAINDSNCWMAEDAHAGKNILIINNINDSDVVDWIKNDWRSLCMPNDSKWSDVWTTNARFCSIVDHSYKTTNSYYSAFDVELGTKYDFPWENFWQK